MKNNTDRFNFSERTKQLVRDKAGGLCSYENCLTPVKSGDSNSGDVAHIFDAATSSNIRGQGLNNEYYIKSEDNGILLCKFHHPISDSRSKPTSPEEMRKWKIVRELSHQISIEDEDIRRSQPHIGNYFIDSIVRQELERNVKSDGFYDVSTFEVKNIRDKCKLKHAIIEIASNVTLYQNPPTPPSSFSISGISEIYVGNSKSDGVFFPKVNDEKIITDFSLILDLIGKWSNLPISINSINLGYSGLIATGQIGLISSGDASFENFNEAVIVPAKISFQFYEEPLPLANDKDLLIFSVKCFDSLIPWKFYFLKGKNGFYEKIEINDSLNLKALPYSLRWNYGGSDKFEIIRKWDRLLHEIDSGKKIIAVFSEKEEGLSEGWFIDEFNPHALTIQLPSFSGDLIKNLRFITSRALLIEKLWLSTLGWRKEAKERFVGWAYTDYCFDKFIDDVEIVNAMQLLEKILPSLHSNFYEINLTTSKETNYQLVLRYKYGEVFIERRYKYFI